MKKERRKLRWIYSPSKVAQARRRRLEKLFSARTNIQRQMNACENLLSEEYRDLQKQLRENAAKIARV